MKKSIFSISAITLMVGSFVFTGCKKDDITAPVVSLTGASSITISLQDNYTEYGATAEDDKDGTITASSSGSVNEDLVGTYTIIYSATDAAGNTGTASRTIYVVNDAEKYEGTYTCTNPDFGSLSPYEQIITASATVNNRIVFSKFAARTGNNAIEAALTGGTAFTIIDKTVSGLGTNSCTFSYTNNGVGTSVTESGGKYSFSIKYFEERAAGGTSCTATTATPYEDTLVQQ